MEIGLIHTFRPYDFEVDTTNAVPSAVATSVLAAWRAGTRRRARGRAYLATGEPDPVPVATGTRRGMRERSKEPGSVIISSRNWCLCLNPGVRVRRDALSTAVSLL